ncbi:hypothetical protein JB92DRAFT_3144395 [Gautieria morchelliformis]|nr:hypothetical protein JB92DRAFT_3144395 [Gautieria morchelliformis]
MLSLRSQVKNRTQTHGRATLAKLGLTCIPPAPQTLTLQQGGKIKVNFKMLHLIDEQLAQIQGTYDAGDEYHRTFANDQACQTQAFELLLAQGLDIKALGDLGNRWSKRWSTVNGSGRRAQTRVLMQCQCGTSTAARKDKEDKQRQQNGRLPLEHDWSQVVRITGILIHNRGCQTQHMTRLPPIPLHDHVWEIALAQLNDGASIAGILARNRNLCHAKLYAGQKQHDPSTANIRYEFLAHDSHRLYKKYARLHGINTSDPPECNVDSWLDCKSTQYKPALAAAIFYYRARGHKDERFRLVLDGTFGICDRRILLFIALGVDEKRQGVPLAFFLSSAPSGNRATHAGYDTGILVELLQQWVVSLGQRDGTGFQPKVAITDTDTKERGALSIVWHGIWLLLCKFHLRQCWTNKHRTFLKSGKVFDFPKEQIKTRLRSLEAELLILDNFEASLELISSERGALTTRLDEPTFVVAARAGIRYLDYLTDTWMSHALWQSWSARGRQQASVLLDTPVEGVLPTTNHLESFNGILKRKHIARWQRGGKRVRFDLLIYLLTTQILPGIFKQRDAELDYTGWLSERFRAQAGGADLARSHKPMLSPTLMATKTPLGWWTPALEAKHLEEASHIANNGRISGFQWPDRYTIACTVASSTADIRLPGHQKYVVHLNVFSWSSCTCPSFQGHNGACKHLYVVRLLVPKLGCPLSFRYPDTEAEAREIHTSLFAAQPSVSN